MQFENIPGSISADPLFKDDHKGDGNEINNEFVIRRVQRDEAIYLKSVGKSSRRHSRTGH